MNKFIALATLVAVVAAEAPLPGGYSGGGGAVSAGRNFGLSGGSGSGSGLNEYVDQALLDRVAGLLASGGDGSSQGQDNEGSQYVDASIFQRVASSLGGGSQRASSEYGAPAPGGEATLGNPEPAQRIAEFDLTESNSNGYQQAPQQQSSGYQQAPPARQQQSGGYSTVPAQQQAPQQSGGYSSQSRGSSSGSSGGSITLGQPEVAQRVAEFEVSGQQQQQGQRGSSSQGGYN